MATKKPVAKKKPTKTAVKKPVKAAKKTPAKKITVKPAVKPAKAIKRKAKATGIAKARAKMVVDTIKLPKGGKVFVKAAKRPATKKSAKKK